MSESQLAHLSLFNSQFSSAFISAHPNTGHNSSFASILYLALVNHLPLTAFEKTFLFFVAFVPGPYSWKLAIFSFLFQVFANTETVSLLLLGLILLTGIFYLVRHCLIARTYRKDPLVFLELTIPAGVEKPTEATSKLFTILHSLAGQRTFIERLVKYRKRYSLELASTKEEGIRYFLGVPASNISAIEHSLRSYLPSLKIKKIKDDLVAASQSEGIKTKIIELSLQKDYVLPLSAQGPLSEHDPIAYFAGNMTKLKGNEIMTMQIIVTPITGSSHGHTIRHINRIRMMMARNKLISPELSKNYLERNLEETLDLVRGLGVALSQIIKLIISLPIALFDTHGNVTPVFQKHPDLFSQPLNDYEQQVYSEVYKKISLPLFETSIRFLIKTNDESVANERARGFLASLATFSNHRQQLEIKSFNPNYLSQKTPFENRSLSLVNNAVLSSAELADLYHFPNTNLTQTEDLIKSKSPDLPVPLSVKNSPNLDVVFGINNYGNGSISIGLTDEERSRHMYMIGQTGSGKSTVLYHMAAGDIGNGRGLAVIDPHGDLAEDLLATVPEDRINDLIYFNPFDIRYPIGINILELPEGLQGDDLELEQELICESVISVFRRVFNKDENVDAHRIEYVLRNTICTAFTVTDATIFTVYELLNNQNLRRKVISKLSDENLKSFWQNEFGKAGDYQIVKMVSGVTAKIGRFLFSPIAKHILEQPRSTIDFNKIVDEGKILLCNLAEGRIGEDTSQLLGTVMVAKIHQAVLRRSRRKAQERRPFYLFVDEFQNFATSSFTKLLSGGRKFGLRVVVAEQSTAQQADQRIVEVVLANTGVVVCFRTASPVDEKLMLAQFRPTIKEGDIANLPRHHFFMRLAALETEDPFSGVTLPINLTVDDEKKERIVEASRKNYASSQRAVGSTPKEQLETIEDDTSPTIEGLDTLS